MTRQVEKLIKITIAIFLKEVNIKSTKLIRKGGEDD